MSFLLDPPVLIIIGALLYLLGNRLGLESLAKMTIGLLVVVIFIIFGIFLYFDIFRCVFPIICSSSSGSELMFHSDITGIYKQDVPLIVVAFLFALYPLFIYFGYVTAFVMSKRRRLSNELFSFKDLKNRGKDRQAESKYEVVRYPEVNREIQNKHQAVTHDIDALGKMGATSEIKSRKLTNLFFILVLTIIMLLFYVMEGYLAISSIYFMLGLVSAIIFAALFATRMRTKDLIVLLIISISMAYLVDHLASNAGMWQYNGPPQLLFPTFSFPLFVIPVIGFSHFLSRVFVYVELSGKRFRNVPFVIVLFAFAAFFYMEGYLALATVPVLAMYAAFALLGLFYNNGQVLEYNLALAIVAAGLGGTMELVGISSGLWSFAFGEALPMFISLAWVLNIGAICGITRIFGINLKDSIL